MPLIHYFFHPKFILYDFLVTRLTVMRDAFLKFFNLLLAFDICPNLHYVCFCPCKNLKSKSHWILKLTIKGSPIQNLNFFISYLITVCASITVQSLCHPCRSHARLDFDLCVCVSVSVCMSVFWRVDIVFHDALSPSADLCCWIFIWQNLAKFFSYKFIIHVFQVKL